MCMKLLNGLSDDFFSSRFAFALSPGAGNLANLFYHFFSQVCLTAEVLCNISVQGEFWDRNYDKPKVMKFIGSLEIVH